MGRQGGGRLAYDVEPTLNPEKEDAADAGGDGLDDVDPGALEERKLNDVVLEDAFDGADGGHAVDDGERGGDTDERLRETEAVAERLPRRLPADSQDVLVPRDGWSWAGTLKDTPPDGKQT